MFFLWFLCYLDFISFFCIAALSRIYSIVWFVYLESALIFSSLIISRFVCLFLPRYGCVNNSMPCLNISIFKVRLLNKFQPSINPCGTSTVQSFIVIFCWCLLSWVFLFCGNSSYVIFCQYLLRLQSLLYFGLQHLWSADCSVLYFADFLVTLNVCIKLF